MRRKDFSIATRSDTFNRESKRQPTRERARDFGRRRNAYLTLLFWIATAVFSHGQTFTSLVSFNGSDGDQPQDISLVQGTDGNLYGTTGSSVFRITPLGALTNLANQMPPAGYFSTASLIQATDLNFYGTTEEGGAHNAGTIFKLTPDGTLSTLYNFCAQSNCTDGFQPDAGLVEGAGGALFGTTQIGGTYNLGTLFKITPHGKLTTLYSFCALTNCADGSYPDTALIRATNGYLYGTTINTIFTVSPTGALTTLYSFGGSDGIASGLVQATDGNFYGTSVSGGNPRNAGTLFRLTPTGVITTLYTFCSVFVGGYCLDGVAPYGSLIQATDGNLYGTTFKITLDGKLTTLYSFCAQTNCDDGEWPFGGLVQATNGTLYGTTWGGGTYNYGTVFRLSTGLHAFVKTLPVSAAVGRTVTILGSGLSNTTGVSFNGTPATFTVVSGSEITTTVPAGATAGYVTVTAPSRMVTSNVPFLLSTAKIATTTTLISSLNPSISGQPVTFTAVVSSNAGAPPNGEIVSFMKGTTILGTGKLKNGSAVFKTSALPLGTTFIHAVYGTDAYFTKSASTVVRQVVK
jgi:uncharacterized repeat protein (TIGR03803 family)